MFSSTLFVVCLLAGLRKTTQPIFTKFKFGGKGGTRAAEQTVRLCWKSGSRYVRVRVWVELGLRLGPGIAILGMGGCVTWQLFNSNNTATSAALTKVCALLSAILVLYGSLLGCKIHIEGYG